MPHVGARAILRTAQREGYGVPCLLAGNMEMLIGAVKAAEAIGAPLILAYNANVTPQIPIQAMVHAMVHAARATHVPVATILDHGTDLATVAQAIQFGISTVMYDGSHLPFTENVRTTQEVVRTAHAAGVEVEGELGTIGGSSIELGYVNSGSEFTDPALAAEFVSQTGIDILAVSFGNAHGVYSGAPRLDLGRVRSIAAGVDVPLAMHGGSGLDRTSYAAVIAAGISKINYYSAMGIAVTRMLRAYLATAPDNELIFHQVIDFTIKQFYTETSRLLTILGCKDRFSSKNALS